MRENKLFFSQKMKNATEFTIGYIGGSITDGQDPLASTTWRALTTTWFREKFPDVNIKEINAAIGGTGSDLGAFRCSRDLLKYKPDLVFIEFTVNDSSVNDPKLILKGMEGIVRQIWNQNNSTDIIFIYTTYKMAAQMAYERNEPWEAMEIHKQIAKHYGIPEINVGKVLWQRIHDGFENWDTLTLDDCHPTECGYAVYAKEVINYLETRVNDNASFPILRLIPPQLDSGAFEDTSLLDAWESECNGWTKSEQGLADKYPRTIICNEPDGILRLKFRGRVIGLYWLVCPDSGDVEWSVDGSQSKRASSWDKYALIYSRPHYTILEYNLHDGEHLLEIKVLRDHAELSTGTCIRIGAFLVESKTLE
jgi:lysophospholipase L1-like esterase